MWVNAYTVNALFKTIIRVQPEDKESFFYEDSAGALAKAVREKQKINWIINGPLPESQFYLLSQEIELDNLYILNNVPIPRQILPLIEKVSFRLEIEEKKLETKPWVSVVVFEKDEQDQVVKQLITETRSEKVIHLSGHDIRFIHYLNKCLIAKDTVIITGLGRHPELRESLQNFFGSSLGYRDWNGDWLQPAKTGGKVILVVSAKEVSKSTWLQYLPRKTQIISSVLPSSVISPLKNDTGLLALIKQHNLIGCVGADNWQKNNLSQLLRSR